MPTKLTKPGAKAASTSLLFVGGLLIVVMAFFLLPTVTAPTNKNPQLQAAPLLLSTTGSLIEVGSATILQGQTGTIAITATVPSTASLNAFTVHIEYDPTILGYVGCSVGSDFTGVCNRSDDDGTPPDVVSFSAVNPVGINGVVELGEMTFNGTSFGTSALHIVVGTWSDGNPDEPILIDGQVIVQGITPSPTFTSTPTSTSTPTPTATNTPTSTPSPSPSPSNTPTATATNTPTATPTATTAVTPTATATSPAGEDYFVYMPAVLNE
ncbi:MAG: hypothetical protein WAM60_14445 [Candidatus Promineifilaceae bacterium]